MNAYATVAASGTPPLRYQWYHNNVELPDQKGSGYMGVRTATLTVEHPGKGLEQAGMYSVVVSNECGQVIASTTLTVKTNRTPVAKVLQLEDSSQPGLWAGWRFEDPSDPFAGNPGPALVVSGTNTLAIAFGTTDDFGLPAPAGQPASLMDVPALPPDTTIQLPAITSTNLTCYTLIMDIYSPSNSSGHVRTLFANQGSTNGGFTWSIDAQDHLHLTGNVGGVAFEAVSDAVILPESWNRLALVVDITESEPSLQMYVNAQPDGLAAPALLGDPIPGLDLDLNATNRSALILSSSTGNNAELDVAGVQLQAVSLASQVLAVYGGPEAGPLIPNDSAFSGQPLISFTENSGCLNLSWPGDQFVLQESDDLTSRQWQDAVVPFTTEEVSGVISNTACVTPAPGVPQRFYRLTFRP